MGHGGKVRSWTLGPWSLGLLVSFLAQVQPRVLNVDVTGDISIVLDGGSMAVNNHSACSEQLAEDRPPL